MVPGNQVPGLWPVACVGVETQNARGRYTGLPHLPGELNHALRPVRWLRQSHRLAERRGRLSRRASARFSLVPKVLGRKRAASAGAGNVRSHRVPRSCSPTCEVVESLTTRATRQRVRLVEGLCRLHGAAVVAANYF